MDKETTKVTPLPGKRYGIGLLYDGHDYDWPKHPRSCVCRGLGYIHVPDQGGCNCGSGEGCGVHDEAWMGVMLCEAKQAADTQKPVQSTESLKATADQLAREWHELNDQLTREKRRLMNAAEEIIDAELAPKRSEIALKRNEARAAIIAYQDARVADAQKLGQPWPEGTLVVRPVEHSGRPTVKKMRGKVEIWRRDTQPMKTRAKASPEPGDVVIRVVHRDGTEGATYEQVYPWWVGSWTAEDGTPPKLAERPPLKL